MKRWRKTENLRAPILDRFYNSQFPDSFYSAFSLIFGEIKKEKEAIRFLKDLNKVMERRKGGGKLYNYEIAEIRNSDGYFDVTKLTAYNEHHVKPRSRDTRDDYSKRDQVILIPEKFHTAWHMIFLNLYAHETIEFLKFIFFICRCKESKEINYRKLNNVIEGLIEKDQKILNRV